MKCSYFGGLFYGAMFSFLLDLFFPRISLTGVEGTIITDEERRTMHGVPLRFQKELLRKRGMHFLDGLIAGSDYKHTPLLRKAIWSLKYKGKKDLHHDLSALMIRALAQFLHVKGSPPVLCPIPLHWSRRFSRGYNQAELLAKDISMQLGWPMKPLLARVHATGHQAWRKKKERLTAMQQAFQCQTNHEVPRSVLLIDDVCTTGATLDSCAQTLKKAGVKTVIALVVAYDS